MSDEGLRKGVEGFQTMRRALSEARIENIATRHKRSVG
jgi:hypothetical protein